MEQVDQSAEVLNRIAQRDAARRDKLAEAAAERREETGSDAAEAEAHLEAQQLAIDRRIRACLDEIGTAVDLAAVAAELEDQQQFLAGHAWLLQPYTLRKAEESIQDLRHRLDAAKAARQPKKKFGFSSRAKATKPAGAPTVAFETAAAIVSPTPAAAPSAEQPQAPADRRLCGLRDQTIVMEAQELDGRDFDVTDAEGCTISLLGQMSALRLRGLRRCRIVAGPVDGATYLEDVHDSTVLLAAQQVRIHTSMGNRLLLSVGSNPIIEHCSGLAFGPLLPAQQAALGLPAVAADGDNNRYANVQDFNWLRSTPSPNWRLLAEEEAEAAGSSLQS